MCQWVTVDDAMVVSGSDHVSRPVEHDGSDRHVPVRSRLVSLRERQSHGVLVG
jgi:hypothetical protein